YLPGLRGVDFEVVPFGQAEQERVLRAVAGWARAYAVATILGTERLTGAGRENVAVVFDARGQVQGYQTTNQVAPPEDSFSVPGLLTLWGGRRPGAGHQCRGSDWFDSRSLCTRALSRIRVGMSTRPGTAATRSAPPSGELRRPAPNLKRRTPPMLIREAVPTD